MRDWDWLTDILAKRSQDQPQLAALQNQSVPRNGDWSEPDSEYEYEYHESETETFYLNVDLNSSGWRGRAQLPNQDKAEIRTTEDIQFLEGIQPSREVISEESTPKTRMPTSDSPEIQIVDLHDDRPIIKYQNQVFECRWANMIGTDLLILPNDANFDGPILKQCEGFKVVAANSVKLISQKITLYEKRDESARSLAQSGPDSEEDEFYIPVDASNTRRNQTDFLKRLAAAKKARGETDKVITQSQKAINAMGPRKNKTLPVSEPDGGQASSRAVVDSGTDSTPRSQVSGPAPISASIPAALPENNGEGEPNSPGRKRQKTSNS